MHISAIRDLKREVLSNINTTETTQRMQQYTGAMSAIDNVIMEISKYGGIDADIDKTIADQISAFADNHLARISPSNASSFELGLMQGYRMCIDTLLKTE